MSRVDPGKAMQKHRTEDEMRKALNDLVNQSHTLHVPPEIDDADVILNDAITGLLQARMQTPIVVQLTRIANALEAGNKMAGEIHGWFDKEGKDETGHD